MSWLFVQDVPYFSYIGSWDRLQPVRDTAGENGFSDEKEHFTKCYALAATYHQKASKRHCAPSTGPQVNQSLFRVKYLLKVLQQKNPESSMTQKHGHGECVRTNELLCYRYKKSANHRMPHRHTDRLKV